MKTKTKVSSAPPKPDPVTPEEIEREIRALSIEDSERIRQYAVNRVHRVWLAANGRDEDDLMQEALIRLVDERRHWDRKEISFVEYYMGAIRSIASAWAGHRKRNKKLPEYARIEADLTKANEEGQDVSPFDSFAVKEPTAEQLLVEAAAIDEREAHSKAFMARVEAEFTEDATASNVIAGILDDMSGSEIRAALELSEKDFKTTMRRVQRHIKKITTEQLNGGQGAQSHRTA